MLSQKNRRSFSPIRLKALVWSPNHPISRHFQPSLGFSTPPPPPYCKAHKLQAGTYKKTTRPCVVFPPVTENPVGETADANMWSRAMSSTPAVKSHRKLNQLISVTAFSFPVHSSCQWGSFQFQPHPLCPSSPTPPPKARLYNIWFLDILDFNETNVFLCVRVRECVCMSVFKCKKLETNQL